MLCMLVVSEEERESERERKKMAFVRWLCVVRCGPVPVERPLSCGERGSTHRLGGAIYNNLFHMDSHEPAFVLYPCQYHYFLLYA